MVGGRRPSVEDDLRCKMTSGGRRPLVEDDLQWKTTFGARRALVVDILPVFFPCMLPTPLCSIFYFVSFIFCPAQFMLAVSVQAISQQLHFATCAMCTLHVTIFIVEYA